MKRLAILLLCFASITSCKQKQSLQDKQKEIENGVLNDQQVYSAKEIGWTISLPAGWEVLTKEEKERMTETGKKLLEDANNLTIDPSGLKTLINLKKNSNSFLSTIQVFDSTGIGSYATANKSIYEMMKNAYADQGIPAEYREDKEMVDGLEFYTFMVKIYSPDKSSVLLNQKMYSRLINDYDFNMTMSYNNETDRQTLQDMIQQSKITIRR